MIINCPSCTQIIAKGFDEIVSAEVDFSFAIRCPHCRKDVTVLVKFESDATPLEIVRVIKQAKVVVAQRNVHVRENDGGGPRLRTLGG